MVQPDPPSRPSNPRELPLSPSAIDPLTPPGSERARLLDTESTPLSPDRQVLISVYAALQGEQFKDRLREELAKVEPGLVLDVPDPLEALRETAEHWGQRSDRHEVHPIQLAFATMSALAQEPDDLPSPRLEAALAPILSVLSGPPFPGPSLPTDHIDRITQALRAAPRIAKRERWTKFVERVGDLLSPQLRRIRASWCENGLVSLRNEVVSKVETRLVVEAQGDTLDSLALAVLPDNWSVCNDFFCSLTRRDDRDAGCVPPATGGDLTIALPGWRGVYEERVGRCPPGWFPDTYLLFNWSKTDDQLILRYELAPSRAGDKSVLRVDEGYLQVDWVDPHYEVSTVKYLLFDDKKIPNGGQTLGLSACAFGWLDYSINQFTDCAAQLSDQTVARDGTAVGSGQSTGNGDEATGLSGDLVAVLQRCEAEIRQSATETDAQLKRIIGRLRDGDYGLDAGASDAGELLTRAIRDGARSVRGQLDLLNEYVDLVNKFRRRGRGQQ